MANIVETTTGRMNMTTKSCEMFVFYTPQRGRKGVQETHLGRAAKDFRGFADAPVRQQGQFSLLPAVNGMPPEIGGNVVTTQYQIEEGAILKVYAKRRDGWNAPMSQSVRYLRVRNDAAYRSITMEVVRDNRAVVRQLEIRGRFDLIDIREVEASGAPVNKMSAAMWRNAGNGELLKSTIIDPERKAPLQEITVAIDEERTSRMVVRPRHRKIDEV